MYAEVVFNLSADIGFDYRIPDALAGQVKVGSRVRAPLKQQERAGYVIRLKAHTSLAQVRELTALEDASRQIPPVLLQLAEWISDYYCCSKEQAVWTLLPAVVRRGEMQHRQVYYLALTAKAANFNAEFEALDAKKKEVIRVLHRLGDLPLRELLGVAEASEYSIGKLCAEGWLRKEKRVLERRPMAHFIVQPDQPKTLTGEQQLALREICAALDAPAGPRPLLLHGVTGSGKTEVYLQAIQHGLALGKEAIVLVPEISLTPQTSHSFRARFGEQVSVLHSGLSDGERFDEWMKINDGRSRIVIGARSALFAPCRRLGLIIVDEEHENSYKQDEAPRYNARDLAIVRAKLEGAAVVLGSATPSLESYYNCQSGRYQLLSMRKRIDERPLPEVQIIDMKTEKEQSGGTLFSGHLKREIGKRLECGEQVILFLNRRGFATQLLCGVCGYAAMCDNCSTAYTYHRKENSLVCHLCGEALAAPDRCPKCGDGNIRYTGFGTEKIESVTRALFPQAMIARMDSDTMTNAESYRKVLDAFRSGHIHILIGTQMLAKGLDFPRVTLVGIINADQGLFIPDFRSAERTFQIITQVAGRAGRGTQPGKVLVQTFTPYHYSLLAAQEHDFAAFCNEEMPTREALSFPPYTRLVMLIFQGEEEAAVAERALAFQAALAPRLPAGVLTIGPMPAPMARIKRLYRYQMLLRGTAIRRMIQAVRQTLAQGARAGKGVDIVVDVDPRSLS